MKPLGKALKAAYYNREKAQIALEELLRRHTAHPATKVTPGDVLFRYGYGTRFPRKGISEEEIQSGVQKQPGTKSNQETD